MQVPGSTRAHGWQAQQPAYCPLPDLTTTARDADVISPSRRRRLQHALALMLAAGTLATAAVMALIDDPRPLDVQLSTALSDAGQTLHGWQQQLSRGLQVSLLAVADGQETAPQGQATTALAPAAAAASAPLAVDTVQ